MDSIKNRTCIYLQEYGVYKRIYSGNLNSNDLIINKKDLFKHELPLNLSAVMDFSNASFSGIKPGDLNLIIEGNLETIKHFNNLKLAIIQNKPYENALTALFIRRIEHLGVLQAKIFITEKGALNWINAKIKID